MDFKCQCCPNSLTDYWNSGYVQTSSYYLPENQEKDKNGIWTCLCLPIKFPLCFPCFLGAMFNSCVNSCKGTNKNYLF